MPSELPGAPFEARTARLLLRKPAEADASFVLALHSASETTEHNPADAIKDLAEACARIELWNSHRDQGLGYWIVEQLVDGNAIGVCGVKEVGLHGRYSWNLLYRSLPSEWGKGYAREAARASIETAIRVGPHRPVIARVRRESLASARVAEAIGLARRPDLDLDGEDGRDEIWSTFWACTSSPAHSWCRPTCL